MNKFHKTSVSVMLIATACTWNIHAKSLSKTLDYAGVKAVVNYDETKVQPYTLEDPLVFTDGTKVENAVDWLRRRREILDIFSKVQKSGAEKRRTQVSKLRKMLIINKVK